MITTDQLEAFDQIERAGTFSRAAQTLRIAQPTISARIQALEEEVGGPLFERGGRQVALTPLGSSYLPYARRALLLLREGQEAALATQSGRGGRVTVGAIESLTGGFLANTVARFTRLYPHAELFIRSAHSRQIVDMLRDGVVKVGLVAWPVDVADVVRVLRFEEPLLLVTASRSPLATRGPMSLGELAASAVPLLHVRWGPTAERLNMRLEEVASPVRDVPIDTALQMALAGAGAAFLTKTLVSEDLAAGRLVALTLSDLPMPTRKSAVVHLRRVDPDDATRAFIDLLAEAARCFDILTR